MACYVNGVTPSIGNVQSTDSIGSGNVKPTSLPIFPDFKKIADKVQKKFIEIENAQIYEKEKALAAEKKLLEEELDLMDKFPLMRTEIKKLYDEGHTDYAEIYMLVNEIMYINEQQNKEIKRELQKIHK